MLRLDSGGGGCILWQDGADYLAFLFCCCFSSSLTGSAKACQFQLEPQHIFSYRPMPYLI